MATLGDDLRFPRSYALLESAPFSPPQFPTALPTHPHSVAYLPTLCCLLTHPLCPSDEHQFSKFNFSIFNYCATYYPHPKSIVADLEQINFYRPVSKPMVPKMFTVSFLRRNSGCAFGSKPLRTSFKCHPTGGDARKFFGTGNCGQGCSRQGIVDSRGLLP